MTERRARHSIKRRLLIALLATILLAWIATLLLSYRDTRHELDELLDAHRRRHVGEQALHEHGLCPVVHARGDEADGIGGDDLAVVVQQLNREPEAQLRRSVERHLEDDPAGAGDLAAADLGGGAHLWLDRDPLG